MAGNAVRERDFGRWLRAWRIDRRITQGELAESLGYDVTYLRKIEGGTRAASEQFIVRLADVVGERKETLLHASSGEGARAALPCAPDLLIGRDAEVEQVVSMLTGPARCVTITGPPGIGKTRLAMEVAHRLEGRFLSGAYWISLLDVGDPARLADHVQRVLGVGDRSDGDPADAVVSHLRPQHALVVFDNFEHVIGARGLVARLLSEAPRVGVLVTSREPLGLVSEHLRPITPLRAPDLSAAATLDSIASSPAVELFVTRALMAWPQFRLTSANCHAVARTCARLDGIPLAIVLAAGLVRTSDPARMDLNLERMDEVAVPPADLPNHHSTLSNAIAWSWSLLDEDEKRTFARLAVFAGGCTADGAAAVCDTEDAWRHLASLSRQSLLEVRPDAPGGARFMFLATVRAFALARLEESDDAERARQAHLAYFQRFAGDKGRGLLGREQLECANALEADLENLRSAFEWALAHRPDAALDLATRLWRFGLLRQLPVGAEWLEAALAASTSPTPARAEGLAAFGSLAWVLCRFDEAAAALDEAAALAEAFGLSDVEALVWLNRGALADQLDDLAGSAACMTRALALYEECDDRRGQASALAGQGWLARRRGEQDEAFDLLIRAAALFREVGDNYNRAKCLSSLGHLSETAGLYAESAEWMTACRTAQQELRDVRGLAITEAALGRIALHLGRHAEARQRHIEALIAFEHFGEGRRAADSLIALAAVANHEGRHHHAARLLGAAEAELERIGASLADDEALHGEVLAACRRRMNDSACHRHLAYGRTLALADAVALAHAHEHEEKNGSRGVSTPAPVAAVLSVPTRTVSY